MEKYVEKRCPSCGQRLRVPVGIGGMLMKCPSCGEKIHSDFKLKGVKHENGKLHKAPSSGRGLLSIIFELPTTIVAYCKRIFFS
jgi:tRNA(Ile2) C34 agmatinyltransferase TiaS